MRCRDFSRRRLTISVSCPSICRFCCQVEPISSASRSLIFCAVSTAKRQGCLPCGDGAQRAASRIGSMNSCKTGRFWYFRTLRLLCINVAKVSVRTGNVTGRCSDCVVTLIYYFHNIVAQKKWIIETYRLRGHVKVFLRFLHSQYSYNRE